jgi:hypothetical protein
VTRQIYVHVMKKASAEQVGTASRLSPSIGVTNR